MGGWNTSAGRAAGLGRFKLFAVGDTAADLLHNFPQGSTHGHFYQAGMVDFPAQGEHLSAGGFFRTHGAEPVGSF